VNVALVVKLGLMQIGTGTGDEGECVKGIGLALNVCLDRRIIVLLQYIMARKLHGIPMVGTNSPMYVIRKGKWCGGNRESRVPGRRHSYASHTVRCRTGWLFPRR